MHIRRGALSVLSVLAIGTTSLIAFPGSAQAADPWCQVGNWYESWRVRASPTANSTLVATMPAKVDLPGWTSNCSGTVTGGSYTCNANGPTYNTWVPVNHKGVKRWTARGCVGMGA